VPAGGETVADGGAAGVALGEGAEGAGGDEGGGGDVGAGAFVARAGTPAPRAMTFAASTRAVLTGEKGRGRITCAMLGRFEPIVNNPLGSEGMREGNCRRD